jgi:hypothetical protein
VQVVQVVALCLCLHLQFLPGADAVCYLEDAGADCAVCWKTTYAHANDTVGVTAASQCPDGIVAEWDLPLPENMVERLVYPVVFSIQVDNALLPVRRKGDDVHVPHANVHSCIASRGACTPFVRSRALCLISRMCVVLGIPVTCSGASGFQHSGALNAHAGAEGAA